MTFQPISSECCSIFKVRAAVHRVGDSFVILPFLPSKVNSFLQFFEKKVQKAALSHMEERLGFHMMFAIMRNLSSYKFPRQPPLTPQEEQKQQTAETQLNAHSDPRTLQSPPGYHQQRQCDTNSPHTDEVQHGAEQ